jgi:hypothetical protein
MPRQLQDLMPVLSKVLHFSTEEVSFIVQPCSQQLQSHFNFDSLTRTLFVLGGTNECSEGTTVVLFIVILEILSCGRGEHQR